MNKIDKILYGTSLAIYAIGVSLFILGGFMNNINITVEGIGLAWISQTALEAVQRKCDSNRKK